VLLFNTCIIIIQFLIKLSSYLIKIILLIIMIIQNETYNNNITFIKKCILFFKKTFGIYLLWIIIHFISVQLYVYFCTPLTLYGFLISPFISCAPHCKALNWTIYNSSNIIEYMWVLVGSWICSKILIDKII